MSSDLLLVNPSQWFSDCSKFIPHCDRF